jgi:putative DNA primase/helicase
VNVGDKDGKLVMRRAWIVEWAELDAMRRARDQEAIKAFLSARVDMFRKPYGRDVIEAPRHCVVVGTTNNREFLHDTTGNRRFWPVEVQGLIDIDWVKANREQLCAEALDRYRKGEQWWLTEIEDQELASVNAEHEAGDVWGDPIADYLHGYREFVTTGEILKEALGKEIEHHSNQDEKRVATILRSLGWVLQRKRFDGTCRRVYVRSA